MTIHEILEDIRKVSNNTAQTGALFERLILNYFLTEPVFANQLDHAWLWSDFPCRGEFGGHDIGVDVVCLTKGGEYWAVQCKCYAQGSSIDKSAVDSFIATSGKSFSDGMVTKHFTRRYWVDSLPDALNSNAQKAMQNQLPQVQRIGLAQLAASSVDWDKIYRNGASGASARQERKALRPDQEEAIAKAIQHFASNDRGKMIMACGTGKTFTSLRLAEQLTGGKGTVLFLVPSISLLSQTLMAWTADATSPISPICICSDENVSSRKTVDDSGAVSVETLAEPATTDATRVSSLVEAKRFSNPNGMLVVFSTYQSIDVVANVQKALGKELEFDLIVCDEAHRTTGVTLANEDESAFVRVHDADFIKGAKRLYMTATPRLYKAEDKDKAKDKNVYLCSMDDESLYGKEFYRLSFADAVGKDLLCDYKVIVLTMRHNPQTTPDNIENAVETPNEWQKLAGTAAALSKISLLDDATLYRDDPRPMHTAVAFCKNIAISKKISNTFNVLNSSYTDRLPTPKNGGKYVQIESRHVDGGMNSQVRDMNLQWLKDTPTEALDCRILCNVRCLSEGVDVPTLDAAIFLSPRKSQIDIVQSVGRVMRKSPGKKFGYLIIPVIVDPSVEADKALDNNEDFQTVWKIACALRSHDDRFNLYVNNPDLCKNVSSSRDGNQSEGGDQSESGKRGPIIMDGEKLDIPQGELETQFYARMVQKVGDRRYWVQWAQDIAQIVNRHIEQISEKIKNDETARKAFEQFLEGLHRNINPSVTQQAAIEMLAQQIVTKPVFEALFEGSEFIANNPISQSLQKVLSVIDLKADSQEEAETLERFYHSVQERASGVKSAEGRQKIIVELYDSFFRNAFPKMVEQLGIVYTPVEVVDFIIHSVAHVLKKEFNRNISEGNVNIIDPFTGTGTFIVRLLQSGLIDFADFERKYMHELRANEIVLLAYYIASINIENTYHSIRDGSLFFADKPKTYTPFEGICLTDTFQLSETGDSDLFSELFPVNSKRAEEQRKTPIHIVIGNPPYSIGQKSANDNAQNLHYPKLEARLESTYAQDGSATNKKSLYDSYIKAFRWATDRLDPKCGGIIGFVSNGTWLDGNGLDGFRKCLESEFESIYVFNLRGNCRTSGELRRKEGGNVFGEGSRTPVSITILVKKAEKTNQKARIYYHDIGDYLSRENKLKIIRTTESIHDLSLTELHPNEHGDWINQRNDLFSEYTPVAPDKKFDSVSKSFFTTFAIGIATNRDSWVYGFSATEVALNMTRMVDFYNDQVAKLRTGQIKGIEYSKTKISWTRALKKDAVKGLVHTYQESAFTSSIYRPFCKQNLYYHDPFIECPGIWRQLFPTPTTNNLVICVQAPGGNKDLSVLIADRICDLHLTGDTQCFPLYYYEERNDSQPTLWDMTTESEDKYIRHDGITDWILGQARKMYGKEVTKEDIFYYVYGFLHCKEYRKTFAADLKKMLPRIPLVERKVDFQAFSKAGRKLAALHLHYEDVPPMDGVQVDTRGSVGDQYSYYAVEKLRFMAKDRKDTIIYNGNITISNIPPKAYEYVVNGKSAIEWILDRYQIKTDKDSGITNDCNDWAREHQNPRYILDLLLSVINVSCQTVDIVNTLPRVTFGDSAKASDDDAATAAKTAQDILFPHGVAPTRLAASSAEYNPQE